MKEIVWILVTLAIYIMLSTILMFSRQTTLSGVRGFDFQLLIRSIESFNKNTIYLSLFIEYGLPF